MSKDNKLKKKKEEKKKEESLNGRGIVTVESRAIKRLSVTCTIHAYALSEKRWPNSYIEINCAVTDIQLHASSL